MLFRSKTERPTDLRRTRALTHPAAFLALLISVVAAAVAAPPGALAKQSITAPSFNVPSGTYSYVARVVTSSGGLCTGTLVKPRWVLTANHCTYNNVPYPAPPATQTDVQYTTPVGDGDITVRVGNTFPTTDGQVRAVVRIVRKTTIANGMQSKNVPSDNDLALLELSSPIFTIPPVMIANSNMVGFWDGVPSTGGPFPASDRGIAVGWGRNAPAPPVGTGVLPAQLQSGSATISKRTVGSLGPYITANGVVCQGDSGGPLLVSGPGGMYQAGVTSHGDCSTVSTFTDVGSGSNHDWLLETMNNVPAGSLISENNPAMTPFGVANWNELDPHFASLTQQSPYLGYQDVIARDDTTGNLYAYLGNGAGGFSSRMLIGSGGWNAFTPFGVADFNQDGYQDVIARNDYTGDLWLYPGSGGALVRTQVMIGHTGWNEYSPYGIANMNGDSYPDLITRNDATGQLFVYVNSGGALVSRSVIANSFTRNQPFGIADLNNDGSPDIFARDNDTGILWLYPFSKSSGTLGAPSQIMNVNSTYTPFGVASFTADSYLDLIVRDDVGRNLVVYPGRLAVCGRTFSFNSGCAFDSPYQIPSGW